MKQFQLKIDGVVQPIRGRSLNPIPSILRYNELRYWFWVFNKDRRIDKLSQLSFSNWLKREGIHLDTYVAQDTHRDRVEVYLELYMSKGKFLNGKPVSNTRRFRIKSDFEQELHQEYLDKTDDRGIPLHLLRKQTEGV